MLAVFGGNRYRIHFEPLAISLTPRASRATPRFAPRCSATPTGSATSLPRGTHNWFNFFDFGTSTMLR
jgi:predicted LPLAT superfamily acyltransferase